MKRVFLFYLFLVLFIFILSTYQIGRLQAAHSGTPPRGFVVLFVNTSFLKHSRFEQLYKVTVQYAIAHCSHRIDPQGRSRE